MNILISAASTSQAHQLLRFLNTTDKVFLADYVDLPHFNTPDKSFIRIPSTNSSSFSHLLLTTCLDLGIDVVYPLRTAEVLALSESRQLFEEYDIKVIVPQTTEIDQFLSDKVQKGQLVVLDAPGETPDRGIFIKESTESNLQLFTAD